MLRALFLLVLLFTAVWHAAATEVEIFVREGCPHCELATRYLVELAGQGADLQLKISDVQRDPEALAHLNAAARTAGVAQVGVPTIRVGSALIVGFDGAATTGAQIRAALERRQEQPEAAAATCSIVETSGCEADQQDAIALPWIGRKLSVSEVGLPLFTIVIGLLDGFNPCSIWVLILMLSMLASLRDRRKMLAIAGTFVAIEGIAYFAFMAAWLNLFLLIGLSQASEMVIGAIAAIAGLINLKDFLALGHGVSLSIPAAAKPGIYARLRAIVSAERLWPALLAAVVLALLVQLVELLCTAGFPALYTRILTLRQLDRASYYGYLLLYNLMYMADDLMVLGIGVVTLSQRRLQEREGRILKLMSGLAMFGLGLYLLLLR